MPRPRTPISSHGVISVVRIRHERVGERVRVIVVPQARPGETQEPYDGWRARARYRFEDGRLRQVERFAPSQARAVAAIKSAAASLVTSTGVETKRETKLRDLAARFLASKADRAPRTVEAYTHSVRHVILPRLGDISVAEATPEQLQRFLDKVRLENGPGAAKMARSVLSGMLGLATRSDAIRQNPVRELEPLKAKAKGAAAVPLDELPALLEATRGDLRMQELDLVDVVEFIAGSGVRVSEALALAWDDVDLAAGTVTIRANVVRATGRGLIRQEHTKSDAGARRITVPGALVGVLGDRRVRGGPNPLGLVFPTVLGNLRDPRNTARDWAEARERLELPVYTFHSFRKTVATALDQAGLSPRDIAGNLGHADPSMTMGVYMSKTVGGSRAASALDAVMAHD